MSTPFDRIVSHTYIADGFRAVASHAADISRSGRAYCPACDHGRHDRKRSLDIAESLSGALLINCWRGCSATEIMLAIGLDVADLYPKIDRLTSPVCTQKIVMWRSAISAADSVEEVGFMMSMLGSTNEFHAHQIELEYALSHFRSAAMAAIRSDREGRGAK